MADNPPKLPQLRTKQAEPGKKTIGDLLERKDIAQRIHQIVPQHMNPERLLRVFAWAIYKTPKLKQCDPMTLLGAMMSCASLGLEPNTPLQHAFLIPFENRKEQRVDVQLIIGYKGYLDLARRSGSVINLHADVVYMGDEFSYEHGSNMHLRHVPKGRLRAGRVAEHAYAHAKLRGGEAFEVLPYEEVLVIRNKSEGYRFALKAKADGKEYIFNASPWVAYEHDMAAKTMIRRLIKYLPVSLELAQAANIDARGETGRLDYAAMAHDPDGAMDDLGAEDRDEERNEEEPKQAADVTAKKNGPKSEQPETITAEQQREYLAAERAKEKPAQTEPAKGRPSLFRDDE